MGFHAKIAAGKDAYGNERVKVAPRVRASARMTAADQIRKGYSLANEVNEDGKLVRPSMQAFTIQCVPDVTPAMQDFLAKLARRVIVPITATLADYRPNANRTEYTCKLRDHNMAVVVRKHAPTQQDPYNGWIAYLTPLAGGTGSEITRIGKGEAIETNKEREYCCNKALTILHLVFQKKS